MGQQLSTYILLFVLVLCIHAQHEEDKGQIRMNKLHQLSKKSLILQFNAKEFQYFAMSYPRPYNLVIFFTASSCQLCDELKPEYQYLAELYHNQGFTTSSKNPSFFIQMQYKSGNSEVYQMFGFRTVPNIIVSKPHMAVVSKIQLNKYMQKFKWSISHNDGHVTTHKLLEFTNQRTNQDVPYKPTLKTMLATFFGFLAVTIIGVIAYIKLKFIWTNWIVWFVASLAIYITCVSGVVYDIIHNTPFVGRDPKTGQSIIFAGGNREQYGAQGLIISIMISAIGVLFVNIIGIRKYSSIRFNSLFIGLSSLIMIIFLVMFVEDNYRSKSHYNPTFFPPSSYLTGPLSVDQGNNI